MMRLALSRSILKRTVSHHALVLRMAHGVDPRRVLWLRKIPRP